MNSAPSKRPEWPEILEQATPQKDALPACKLVLTQGSLGVDGSHRWQLVRDTRGFKEQHRMRVRIVRNETKNTVFDSGWIRNSEHCRKFDAAKAQIEAIDKMRGNDNG